MTFLFLNILDIGRHIVPWCLAVYQGTAGSCILPKEALVPIHTPFLDKIFIELLASVQFSCSGCPTLCSPMDCSMPGFPAPHYLPEFAQTHVHRASDAIQPSRLLSSHSPPTFDLPQNQGLFQWVSSSHQVAKVLVLQLQHQSFQWIFRIDFL